MTANVMNDLKMAEISLAKVPDVNNMVKEANEVMDDFRVNVAIRDEVQAALDTVEQRSDYQLTIPVVTEVDQVINKHSNIVLKNDTPMVSGTEAFGLSLLPSEWRILRTGALKEILAESYKNIKRWANTLSENFERIWTELNTSIEVLETRLEATVATLDVVTTKVDGINEVEINELVARSISKNGKLPGGDIAAVLKGEVNYILLCLRAWSSEQIKYKGDIIRYFGNERNVELDEVVRVLPKVFDQRAEVDPKYRTMLTARATRPMIGDKVFEGVALDPKWVRDNIKSVADNTTYADALSFTGYHVEDYKASAKAGKATMSIMTMSQMYALCDLVENILGELRKMNSESDPTNFNPDDVKDVLGTLKATNTSDQRAYQYGLMTADYQYNVNNFKTQSTTMLTVLASHLITLINAHLANYNVN